MSAAVDQETCLLVGDAFVDAIREDAPESAHVHLRHAFPTGNRWVTAVIEIRIPASDVPALLEAAK